MVVDLRKYSRCPSIMLQLTGSLDIGVNVLVVDIAKHHDHWTTFIGRLGSFPVTSRSLLGAETKQERILL